MSDYDDEHDHECWNCGGEGFVTSCFEEWACVDPEGGCDQCIRHCSICNSKKPQRHLLGDADSSSAEPSA